MDGFLNGFSEELTKLASGSSDKDLDRLYRDVKARSQAADDKGLLRSMRGSGRRVSRDYLASALLGGIATPAALLLGRKVTKGMNNKEIMKALSKARLGRKRSLKKSLHKGKTLGAYVPGQKESLAPLMTHTELAGHGARGAVMGSAIQMLRDRFSGSAGKGDKH